MFQLQALHVNLAKTGLVALISKVIFYQKSPAYMSGPYITVKHPQYSAVPRVEPRPWTTL
jgi:hypothetical protein